MRRYLLELTVRHPVSGATEVLRLTERSSYTTGVTDSPALAWYRPWAVRLCNYERGIFGAAGGIGEALLGNGSRWLDAYRDHAFVSAGLLEGPLGRGVPYAAFSPLFSGTVAGREYSGDTVSVRFSDAAVWGAVIPRRYYKGDNNGQFGIEGNAELAGKVVPICMGYVANMAPELVNPSLLIYQATDGACSIEAVRARGLALNNAGDVGAGITSTSMPVPAGGYITDQSRGLFRLGSAPGGPVTCELWGAPVMPSVAAQVAALAGRMGISAGMVALDAAWANSIGRLTGLLVPDGATGVDVLNAVIGDAGGWWWVDPAGVLRAGELVAPETRAASRVLTTADYTGSLDDVALDEWATPVWKVEWRSRRNYQPLAASDLNPQVSAKDAQWLTREWRSAVTEVPAVRAAWPGARAAVVESGIVNGGAGAWLALRAKPRRLVALNVSARTLPGTWPLGSIIEVRQRGGLPPVKMLLAGVSTEDGRSFSIKGFV